MEKFYAVSKNILHKLAFLPYDTKCSGKFTMAINSHYFCTIANICSKYDFFGPKDAKSLRNPTESAVCHLCIVATLNLSHAFPEAQTVDMSQCHRANTTLPADQAISEAINPRASSAYA